MQVICKIFSTNFLLHLKLKDFINKTPFFLLSELDQGGEEEQILFWDIDSKDIDKGYLEKRIKKGSVIMIISSLYTQEYILNNFQNNERIGILAKNVSYKDFVQEISRMADVNPSNS